MKLIRILLAAAAALVVSSCSSASSDVSASYKASQETSPGPKASASPHKASAKEREAMREWFMRAAGAISTSTDMANGLSHKVAADPDDSSSHAELSVPQKIEERDVDGLKISAVPAGWEDARDALLAVVEAVDANIDTLQQAHDGDSEASRRALDESARTTDLFCSALSKARRHYTDAGGRANDLDFFYASGQSDVPCVHVEDAHPQSGTIKRDTVAISAFEVFSGVGGQGSDPGNDGTIDEFGDRLKTGDRVTIVERRTSFDDGVPELCRSKVPGKTQTYWIACRDITIR